MSRRMWLLWLTAVLLQCWLASPLWVTRIESALWWPILAAMLLCAGKLLWPGPTWQPSGIISRGLLFSGILTLPCGLWLDWAWAGSIGLWFSLASLAWMRLGSICDRQEYLTCTLPWLLFAGFPAAFSARIWNKIVTVLAQDGLIQSANTGRPAWLDHSSVNTTTAAVDVSMVLNSATGWLLPVSIILLWNIRLAATFLYSFASFLLSLIGCFSANVLTVRLLIQSAASGGLLYENKFVFTTLLIAIYAVIAFLSDAVVFAIAAPVRGQSDDPDNPAVNNPFRKLWNRAVSGVRSEHSKPIEWRWDDGGLIPVLPALRLFLRDWLGSRLFRYLPALIALICLPVCCFFFVWSLPMTQRNAVTRMYAAAESVTDTERGDILRCLLALQPRNAELRLEFVEWLFRYNQLEECFKQYRRMVPDDAAGGSAAARLWLVRNSMDPAPLLTLTDQQRIQQLAIAKQIDRSSAVTFGLLGQLYLRNDEAHLAIQNLTEACELDEEWTVALLDAYRSAGIVPDKPERFVRYGESLRRQLTEEPTNSDFRRRLVQLELTLGDGDAALELINAGRVYNESEEWNKAEYGIRLSRLQSLVNSTGLQQPAVVIEQLETLIRIAPHATETLSAAVDLYLRLGWRPTASNLTALVEQRTVEDAGNEVKAGEMMSLQPTQAYLKLLQDDAAAAIELLQAAEDLTHRDRLTLVNCLIRSERTAEAEQFVRRHSNEILLNATLPQLEQLLELACTTAQFEEADQWLETWSERTGQQIPGLRAQVRLKQLDAAVKYPGFLSPNLSDWRPESDAESSEELLALISECLAHPHTRLAAADRCVSLLLLNEDWHSTARAIILSIRSDGNSAEQTLFQMGNLALQQNKAAFAVECFEAAEQQAKQQNPWLLNNLANALLQLEGDSRKVDALRAVDQALTLLPREPALLRTRAAANLALQNYPAARRDLEASRKLQPDNKVAAELELRLQQALESQR